MHCNTADHCNARQQRRMPCHSRPKVACVAGAAGAEVPGARWGSTRCGDRWIAGVDESGTRRGITAHSEERRGASGHHGPCHVVTGRRPWRGWWRRGAREPRPCTRRGSTRRPAMPGPCTRPGRPQSPPDAAPSAPAGPDRPPAGAKSRCRVITAPDRRTPPGRGPAWPHAPPDRDAPRPPSTPPLPLADGRSCRVEGCDMGARGGRPSSAQDNDSPRSNILPHVRSFVFSVVL